MISNRPDQLDLTVIIPFHHEGAGILSVLQPLQAALDRPHEVLLVHDDPGDATLPVLEAARRGYPNIRTLLNSAKRGAAGAIYTGLGEARGRYVLFLVADDPGPVPAIGTMIGLLDQGYDLVGTTRYARGGKNLGGACWTRWCSALGNGLFRALTAGDLSDPTVGFKMFRRDILQKINLTSEADWTFAFELAIRAQYHGLKVTEIPLTSYNRVDGGRSHFRFVPRVFHYSKTFLWGLQLLWRKKIHA